MCGFERGNESKEEVPIKRAVRRKLGSAQNLRILQQLLFLRLAFWGELAAEGWRR